jgi:hypothetical protein
MRDYADIISQIRIAAIGVKKQSNRLTMMQDAADAIEELLAAVPHWISVEERLPEKDEMVIVYYSWTGQSGTEYKEVSLATLDEMRYCGNKLLGWMPLPEPPKEETE